MSGRPPRSNGVGMGDSVSTEPAPSGCAIAAEGIWESYTVRDGLPDMKIECVFEDSSGNIWVGTHDGGLALFDGRGFTTFSRRHGLSGDGVYSILEDGQGHLWLGTNRGLTRFNGQFFEAIAMQDRWGLLWGSCVDAENGLWFGLDRRPGQPAALCNWDGARARTVPVRQELVASGESINTVRAGKEGLWVGGEYLYRLDADGGVEVQPGVRSPRSISSGQVPLVAHRNGVSRLAVDGRTHPLVELVGPGASCAVWTGEDSGIFSDHHGQLMSFSGADYCVIKRFTKPVQAILGDNQGRLWIATYGQGLFRCDAGRWKIYPSNGDQFVPWCLDIDPDGRVIAGATSGLWVGGERDRLDHVETPFSENREVTSVCAGSGQPRYHFGTRHGYVARVSESGVSRLPRPPGGAAFRIENLTQESATGLLWYSCGPGMGLGYFAPDGSSKHFGPGNKDGYPLWVGALAEAGEGKQLLVGTCENRGSDGIYVIHPNRELSPICKTGDRSVTALAEVNGTVYVGTNHGLFEMDGAALHEVLDERDSPCRIIVSLSADHDGSLWVGIEGGVVLRYREGVAQQVSVPRHAEYGTVHAIRPIDRRSAWIATSGGLLRYTGAERSLEVSIALPGCGVPDAGSPPVVDGDSQGIEILFSSRGRSPSGPYVTYTYRIAGLDRDWSRSQTETVTVPTPEPGDYAVEAFSVDEDFNLSDVAMLKFTVEVNRRDLLLREALDNSEQAALIGEGPVADRLRRTLEEFAANDLSVLLLGQTGTGKSLAARYIHDHSPRRDGPFVQINCAAISETLAESELFGHEKGAFTGAVKKRVGKFSLADRGTAFLDEIGDLPNSVQAKLLHVLQEHSFEAVGGTRSQVVDVRVIAATNRDLHSVIERGDFRSDLYFRLNALSLEMPSLLERIDELPLFVEHFAMRFARHLKKPVPRFTPGALRTLETYEWPGNIRELEHVVQRAVALTQGGQITAAELSLPSLVPQTHDCTDGFPSLKQSQKEYLESLLRHTRGRIEGAGGAAEISGTRPSTLRSRLRKHGIR